MPPGLIRALQLVSFRDLPGTMSETAHAAPSLADLEDELTIVWQVGLNHLRSASLPLLRRIAGAADPGTTDVASSVEPLLRISVERLGSGREAAAAAQLFGLAPAARGGTAFERRVWAADAYGISYDSFRRKKPERRVYEAVGHVLLVLVEEARLRSERMKLEIRKPADSRLAVQWVERFEAYYRLWTPIMALGGDLTAYRATLLDPERPFDRPDDVWVDPLTGEERSYTQEFQAEGYARMALFDFAEVKWELKQFMIRHGGMWLLSSAETEVAVADAVYRMGWHSPWNERDESWLRSALQDSRGRELHHFLNYLKATTIGQETRREWQEWAAECRCTWDLDGHSSENEYFPTRKHHTGIAEDCGLHLIVSACAEYCDLIDRDWQKIADWYYDGGVVRRGIRAVA